jgi:PAS domain S-box-containing protein
MKSMWEKIPERNNVSAKKRELSPSTLESVFNTLHEGVFIYDIQGKKLSMNPAALKMHGFKAQKDFQSSVNRLYSLFEILEPTGRILPVKEWPFSRILRGESFSNLELIVRRRDSSWEKFWSYSGTTVFDKNGRPKLAIVSIQDITQRKQTEQALRESEQEFRAFFDNSAVGNAQVDMEGRFIRVNDRMCEITGFTREELLKMSPVDITHPEDRQKEKEGLEALMGGKTQVHKLEKRYIRKDGEIIWVQIKAGIVHDAEGNPLRSVATIQNITQRKRLTDDLAAAKEEAEKRSSELFAAMESLAEGVIFYDTDHKITHMNTAAQKILGFSLEEVKMCTEERIHLFRIRSKKGHVPEKRELPGYRASQGEVVINEEFLVYPKGSKTPIHLLSSAAPIKLYAGTAIGAIQTIIDISETLEVRRQAEEANRAKSQFLAIMSHEIRTPMTTILGMLDLTLNTRITPDQRRNLAIAKESADSLLYLINDLLDLSRIEAKKFEFVEESFDLWKTLNRVMEILSPKAREKGLNFSLKIGADMNKNIVGDSQRLKQVLINLLGNAIKFTHQGEVTLTVEICGKSDSDETIRFKVRDTGIGIPAEKIRMLFDPFQQLDQSLTRTFGGMGLGLTISQEIVHQMGGEIEVESELGKGSVFSFTANFALGKTAACPDKDQKEEFADGQNGIIFPTLPARLLIAEDEPMLRKLIQLLLLQTPWRSVIVTTGKEAVNEWKKGDFELILMDVQMPEMDGLEATRTIRKSENKTGKRTPIVALTAHARKEEKELCLEAGMDDCLTKPFKSTDLFSMVERHLRVKRA